VASSQETQEETPWGWIAFGILAAAVVVGGIVWWLRRRSAHKDGGQPAPPAGA
jgi:membrane protein DedA with SNARE-associated domain